MSGIGRGEVQVVCDFDESNSLISLGPFFGGDAADECTRSLERLGLTYIDDFFVFEGLVPDWCSFEVF
ncbi:hypothetical protein BED46_013730 [Burkholderia contaminans]|uniref:Uncharacterized protein n=1 Tax=Burkholderia contaminans LMG 23361 TaxID=1334628 RepID=A0ABD4AJE0_9BURK|nr:hypothetical protein WR31_29785 [Burkholderia contaminans LMG 23361]MBA9839741.1 hypothetical protein [Burkholderia contaminans]MBA9862813.1 hypothetical protein [Burkholderia contaminans]MBA9929930.1 hypothetical protein [Burkholderia contaminans]MCB4328727.1 hypothetical protein [Burkholderia contaminans]